MGTMRQRIAVGLLTTTAAIVGTFLSFSISLCSDEEASIFDIGYLYGSFHAETARGIEMSRPVKSRGAFVLLVNVTFKSKRGLSSISFMKKICRYFNNEMFNILSSEKEDFADTFSKYTKYISIYEPTTLSYELVRSDTEENRLLLIERYVNKEAYTDVHKKSLEFLNFRAKLNRMDVIIDGHSYFETNIGFVSNSLDGFHAGDNYHYHRI